LYALREFWLKAREEVEASGADIQAFEEIAEDRGYVPTNSTAIGGRVWSVMVTQHKSLNEVEVMKELGLPTGDEIQSFEEPAGWIRDGKITHAFKASAYFCGVLAGRRAQELQAEAKGAIPAEDPFEVTRRAILEQAVSNAQRYIAARLTLGNASPEQLVLDAWRDCLVARNLGLWMPDLAEFCARLQEHPDGGMGKISGKEPVGTGALPAENETPLAPLAEIPTPVPGLVAPGIPNPSSLEPPQPLPLVFVPANVTAEGRLFRKSKEFWELRFADKSVQVKHRKE
jgi:hypothetical protein